MDNREQYLDTYTGTEYSEYHEYPRSSTKKTADEKNASGGTGAVAKVLLWVLGSIVGITILFGCGIFWIWGLDYLGVIDFDRAPVSGQNEFNQPADDYDEFEEFYDYFDDYFSGQLPDNGFSDGGDDSAAPQAGTPGIGVTIQEINQLDIPVDETYVGGLVVLDINPAGALVGKDIQIGDLIVAANGNPITTIDGLDVELIATGVGGEMTLTVARFVEGVAQTHEIEITLIDVSTLS